MIEREGVTKFTASHRAGPLPASAPIADLLSWREILVKLGILGADPARYGGIGFGNASVRLAPFSMPRGARRFLITGTQTASRDCAAADALCVVERWRIEENRVESQGPVAPSSEAMTHGAIYDLSASIRAVLHGHAPLLWKHAAKLRIPATGATIPYGTPQMAREMARLFRETALAETRVFAMAGHEDGVVAFGRDLAEAGTALVCAVARAYAIAGEVDGELCGSAR